MTDTDDPSRFARRTARRAVMAAVVLAVGLVSVAAVFGGRVVSRAVEVRHATALYHAVRGDGVIHGWPLTDPEFDRAVVLFDASSAREARSLAAEPAGELAGSAGRRSRLAGIARRQIAGDHPDDRHTGLKLASLLNPTELRQQADALRGDPDPLVRVSADLAVARLADPPL